MCAWWRAATVETGRLGCTNYSSFFELVKRFQNRKTEMPVTSPDIRMETEPAAATASEAFSAQNAAIYALLFNSLSRQRQACGPAEERRHEGEQRYAAQCVVSSIILLLN